TVSEPARPTGRYQIVFTVRDTGIGIPAALRDELFKPFTQAESSSTRSYGGTGLGLAICKRLVEMMGGTIQVDSVEGQGATFSFSIVVPAVRDAASEVATTSPARAR
ncbi:MAG: ATP-binding protein, partial [Acidobacteriota bacterium]